MRSSLEPLTKAAMLSAMTLVILIAILMIAQTKMVKTQNPLYVYEVYDGYDGYDVNDVSGIDGTLVYSNDSERIDYLILDLDNMFCLDSKCYINTEFILYGLGAVLLGLIGSVACAYASQKTLSEVRSDWA